MPRSSRSIRSQSEAKAPPTGSWSPRTQLLAHRVALACGRRIGRRTRRIARLAGQLALRIAMGLAVLVGYFALLMPALQLRGIADDVGFGVHRHFNLVESVIFTDAPNHWLQSSLLFTRATEYAGGYLYVSWYLIPIIATLPLIWSGDWRAFRMIAFLLLTFTLAIPFFALYPLAPPWAHDPGVQRVIALLDKNAVTLDPNPYASMPSLHVAIPMAAALWYGPGHAYRRVLIAYTAVIAVTVVFTGDHYVADVVAGIGWACLTYLGVRKLNLPLLYERRDPARAVDRAPASVERPPVAA